MAEYPWIDKLTGDAPDWLRRCAGRLSSENRLCSAFRLYEGLCCEWCNSLWFSPVLVLLWYYFGEMVIVAVLPLALSAWVVVMKYLVHTLQGADKRLNSLAVDLYDESEVEEVGVGEWQLKKGVKV